MGTSGHLGSVAWSVPGGNEPEAQVSIIPALAVAGVIPIRAIPNAPARTVLAANFFSLGWVVQLR